VDGATGALVAGRTAEAWAQAIRTTIDARLAPEPIRRHALKFGRERFAEEIKAEVDRVLASA
jgi:hypothetical protein